MEGYFCYIMIGVVCGISYCVGYFVSAYRCAIGVNKLKSIIESNIWR